MNTRVSSAPSARHLAKLVTWIDFILDIYRTTYEKKNNPLLKDIYKIKHDSISFYDPVLFPSLE